MTFHYYIQHFWKRTNNRRQQQDGPESDANRLQRTKIFGLKKYYPAHNLANPNSYRNY